jgi:hypothetical protein
MPDPIVITVTAVPDPATADTLLVSVDLPLVFLASDDDDEARWICSDGSIEVNFAPVTNPFDSSASSGGQYQTQADGSIISGPLDEAQLDPDETVFRIFKYSINVTSFDGLRAGTLDPRFMVRKKRVYSPANI